MTLASSLADAIKECGITQAQIARELNVSAAWVSQRLTGARGSIADLEAIAAVTGLKATWVDAEPEPQHWYGAP